MSTDRDRDNLLDPTHPHSPYNKFNYDSPHSFRNPLSQNYNPAAAALAGFVGVVCFLGFGMLVFMKVFLTIGLDYADSVCPGLGAILAVVVIVLGLRLAYWGLRS